MSTIQVRAPGRVRLTVEEFARQDAGLFDGSHVQLLDGELYEVTKKPSAQLRGLGPGRRPALASASG